MKGYTTISKEPSFSEIIINKSRFIGYAVNVETAEEAQSIIKGISKKYYDATHNCFAYVTSTYSKYSDDGEPQGTAGLPILDCIKKSNLCDCLVIVTRYFGGVKLGAGGLVRAYTACANAALTSAPKIELRVACEGSISVPYDLYKAILNKIASIIKIKDTQFGDSVTINYLVEPHNVTALQDTVSAISKGKMEVKIGDTVLDTMEK